MPKKSLSFEDAIHQLEQIVKDLEAGDLPLEKAIKTFEEGVRLSKFCTKKLNETEKRITVLLENEMGDLVEEPFGNEDTSHDKTDAASE